MKKLVFIEYDKVPRLGPGMALCLQCCRFVFWRQDDLSGLCPHCKGWPGALEAQKMDEFKNQEKILNRQKIGKTKKPAQTTPPASEESVFVLPSPPRASRIVMKADLRTINHNQPYIFQYIPTIEVLTINHF
jgi:hypothetical protein